MKKTLTTLATALSLALLSHGASAQMLSLATPPQGSVWNTMSTAVANVIRAKENVNALVQPYSGNRAMMDAVDQGLAEFAINDVNDVIIAARGSDDYDDRPRSNLRVAMVINPQPIGIFVRRDAGIDTIADLAGKRVASGWNAFPLGRSHMEAMMATGGVSWDDVQQVPVPDLIRAADTLASGRLDATFFAVGGPKVAEVDASVGGVKFLPVPTDEAAQEAMLKVRPAFYITEVYPAPHIAGIDEPIAMVTWDNVLVVGKHVPDEQVYKTVSAILENKDELSAIFPGFRTMSLDEPSKAYPGLEYHPGAVRYFKEKGLWHE
ncbi:C4-dicarboxylate ABC transporter substrate-binding protein [Zobellella endophytica]|uniref:C4-dicarboxylate ABC transporter substrate-binding protein n=1 Tax=Zobellella endophytica TaxID=2116700 RepID=A0A2P7R3Y8_9GAMM|nr:TAXI family TRAP transporter solute-binding subunit [Zobellella endophytica]PSJ44939.1 C4-dicarboxylate ABC transporter substrate-binding protein [Zobellella endophytica]